MTHKEERLLIEKALISRNANIDIPSVCKKILRDRIDHDDIHDIQLRHIIEDVIKNLDFSVETKLSSTTEVQVINTPNNIDLSTIMFGGVLIAGVAASTSDNALLSSLGAIISAIAGFKIGKTMIKPTPHENIKYNVKITSSPDSIIMKIDNIYNQFKSLFYFNQLEGYHKDILSWLQNRHSESSDISLKRSIENLLTNSGYEFLDYDPIYNEGFRSNKSVNITSPQTTMCAVRNNRTKKIVLQGHVIFPMDE